MEKHFNEPIIISLLQDLDKTIKNPCSIVICGGAAAIIGYGLKRFTGDIDIFEPMPKSDDFYKAVKLLLENHCLDPHSINDGAKGFSDDLSPNYRKRVIPLKKNFNNLTVYIISKADFITMKICAWRESDMNDIKSIGISKEDLPIINENLTHLAQHNPDRAHKAKLVLAELGLEITPKLEVKDVKSLSELIQFYTERTNKDASLDEIREWKKDISLGLKPSLLASLIIEEKDPPSIELDI